MVRRGERDFIKRVLEFEVRGQARGRPTLRSKDAEMKVIDERMIAVGLANDLNITTKIQTTGYSTW